MVRYKIASNMRVISTKIGKEFYLMYLDHSKYIYFLNIVSKITDGYKVDVDIFMPDGSIQHSMVSINDIGLHDKHELFDGRFNNDN